MRQAGAVAGVRFGIAEVTEHSSIHSLPVSGVKMESVKVEKAKMGNAKMENGKVKEETENNSVAGIPEGADLFGFDSMKQTEVQTESPDTPSPIPQIGMISDLVTFAAPLDP